MCGIIAFLGHTSGIIKAFEGLVILQNRGYDSAGICSVQDGEFTNIKHASDSESAISKLKTHLSKFETAQNLILHTRWATNGTVNDQNSHPHVDHTGKFSLVHNGIIENANILKRELIENGFIFCSETDTEVIVNLIGYYYQRCESAITAIEMAIDRLEGTWGLVIQCLDNPDKIYCARHGSPLLIGFNDDYAMIASEQSGFSRYIDQYISLENSDIVELKKNAGSIAFEMLDSYDIRPVTAEKCQLSPDPYPHWTIKEINEQYESSVRAMGMGGRIVDNNRVILGGLNSHQEELVDIDNLILLGCGTSYHAGLYTIDLYKRLAGFNTVQIFDGADFTARDIPKNGKTGLILLSQSGETRDLHRCIQIANDHNLMTIGVVNVVDSLIARDVHCGVYLNAGKEVGVASTKAFTSQVIVLSLIAVWFAQQRDINKLLRIETIKSLRSLPFDLKRAIANTETECIKIAEYFAHKESIFLLGKGPNEAVAREGALKIKELGYINANGCATSSLKHGPYALIEEGFPVVTLVPEDPLFNRNTSVSNELKSRNAWVVGISDKQLDSSVYDFIVKVPKNSLFFGVIANICLQLVAYHTAVIKGNTVDCPKNLAKTVTTD